MHNPYKLAIITAVCIAGFFRGVLGLAGGMFPGLEALQFGIPHDATQYWMNFGMSLFLMGVFSSLAVGYYEAGAAAISAKSRG